MVLETANLPMCKMEKMKSPSEKKQQVQISKEEFLTLEQNFDVNEQHEHGHRDAKIG